MRSKPGNTIVESLPLNKVMIQQQKYITDKLFPYWLIYRNKFFDEVASKLEFNHFTVFRDRQITNSKTRKVKRKTV